MLKAFPYFPPPQATDEDSPPNNVLTYTITSATAFPDYFRIVMVEGYAGGLTVTFCHSEAWFNAVGCYLTHSHLPRSFFLPVINVISPLDYEKVPKGSIYLTVMAKDGGSPSLNSTVPVTVEVIVSTFQHTHTVLARLIL